MEPLIASAVQDTNVILGLKLLTTGTNVKKVLCTGKEIRSGLKLARMETDLAKHICKLLSRKKQLNIAVSILFFCKFLRSEGLSQKWAYFTLKLYWLKTDVGRNIRPQNNMYLSAPEYPSS